MMTRTLCAISGLTAMFSPHHVVELLLLLQGESLDFLAIVPALHRRSRTRIGEQMWRVKNGWPIPMLSANALSLAYRLTIYINLLAFELSKY
ncbi:hypothetical protein [Burkholderia gladioli]|uniref:hypothetical protein n=1 Tax=Burkholderia gladioli TaxID=28095 RepID=UPI0026542984|nr:hypothetical protein [Burkholderia gladioli]MDN7804298.1 hypothetical protein [Burkholderia gladioli]